MEDSTNQPLKGSTPVRVLLVMLIVASVLALFAYAGGWLSPHALTPAKIVDRLEQVSGPHPGFRRNHAKGVCFSGYFDADGSGVTVSKASVFQSGRTPVIGRFSFAGGQPFQADSPHTVRAMAILFKLADGEQWRTGMLNLPVFAVQTPRQFYDQILANRPDLATGKPNPQSQKAFLTKYPAAAAAQKIIRANAVSCGFENSTYNGLNAFMFKNQAGESVPVRWSMVPVQPFIPAGPREPGVNYLFDQLIAAVHTVPLKWHFVLTVGEPGDPTNDATLPWPPDRKKIDVGILIIDQIESEDTSPARDINFDPLILPDGIGPSDDPLLSARSAAYAQSYLRREGESKQPSAISPAEVAK